MEELQLKDKVFVKNIDASEIANAITAMATQMQKDLDGVRPIFVSVLNGAFVFAADFVRAFTADCEISFVKLASYEGTSSTGTVKKLLGLSEDLTGRTVVVLEDIVDTGKTVEVIAQLMADGGVADLKIASLFLKPDVYAGQLPIDYVGMEIPNDFIVGYGLDYDGLGRNLKHIYKLKENA